MKFDLFALPTIPGTLEERKALRPIGRNNERYQQMLEEIRQMVVMADDMGFDVFSTTEHHFHSEGFEASALATTAKKRSTLFDTSRCVTRRLPSHWA